MTSVHSVQPDDIAEEMADERDWGVARAWHMGVAAGRIAFDRRGYHAIRESSRIRCSEQLMKRVFDEVLVCRASHTRLEVSGAAAPVTVPGCGCVVSSGAGRHFSKMGRCGLCKTALPGGTSTDTDADAREGFRTNAAALQLVRDANNIRLPLLEDIFMYSSCTLLSISIHPGVHAAGHVFHGQRHSPGSVRISLLKERKAALGTGSYMRRKVQHAPQPCAHVDTFSSEVLVGTQI